MCASWSAVCDISNSTTPGTYIWSTLYNKGISLRVMTSQARARVCVCVCVCVCVWVVWLFYIIIMANSYDSLPQHVQVQVHCRRQLVSTCEMVCSAVLHIWQKQLRLTACVFTWCTWFSSKAFSFILVHSAVLPCTREWWEWFCSYFIQEDLVSSLCCTLQIVDMHACDRTSYINIMLYI